MKITFRRDILANYMVIENVEGFCEDDFMVKMLERNNIRNLLEFDHEDINGKTNLLYDISSKQAMPALFETQKLSYEVLKKFIYSLKSLLDTLEEYLLDPDNVVLKKECIFADLKTGRFSYCYDPYYNGDLKTEIKIISDELLGFVDHEDQRAVKLVYDMNRECHRESFTADALIGLEVPEKEEPEKKEEPSFEPDAYSYLYESVPGSLPAAEIKEEPSAGFFKKLSVYLKGRSVYDVAEDIDSGKIASKIKESDPMRMPNAEPDLKEKGKRKKQPGPQSAPEADGQKEPSIQYIGDEEDGLILEEVKLGLSAQEEAFQDETCLLGEEREKRRLVGMGRVRGIIMEIDAFPYTIGKLEDKVDAVSHSPAVSRMHCRIYENILDEEGYFFEDLNSKNGSYINNIRVDPYKRMPLRPGDIIKIADEEYAFR